MKKGLMVILSFLALLTIWGCGATTTTTTTTSSLELLDRGTVPTDQTVYIEAGTDGTIGTMIVVSRIPRAIRGTYCEYGRFTASQNLTGSQPIEMETGQLFIPVSTDGADFYYRTTLADGYEPPFLLTFKYRKDGVLIDPAIEKGNDGHYTVEIEVTANPEAEDGFLDRFMCQVQVAVPATGTQITGTMGGTVVLAGGTYTIGFMTLPGTSATYSLTLDTDAFSIRSIQATFTPFNPEVLGEDLSGIGTGLQTLLEGLIELRDGQTQLKDGLETLSSTLALLSAGSWEATEGLDQLALGLGELTDSAGLLSDNLALIAAGANQLKTSGVSVLAGYDGLMSAVNDVYGTFAPLHSDDVELMTKLITLTQTATAIESALETYVDGVNDCADGLASLSVAMNQWIAALETAEAALRTLAESENELSAGLEEVAMALTGIPESLQAMIDAQTTIISNLSASLNPLAFLLTEAQPLWSFTSSANPTPNSVQFIYSVSGF